MTTDGGTKMSSTGNIADWNAAVLQVSRSFDMETVIFTIDEVVKMNTCVQVLVYTVSSFSRLIRITENETDVLCRF